MFRLLLRFLHGIISFAVATSLVTAGAYAGYALWDNQQVYSAAESTQLEMLRFKPRAVTEAGVVEEAPSFDELLAINPDVCGWVTMDNTAIDHPILQGRNNLSYINMDVYGNFALAGSIFLDTRCSKDCSGNYNLLYGHHMDNHGMFGDLDLYKDEAFFNANTTGTLILPAGVYALRTMACIVTEASDDALFDPDNWQESTTDTTDVDTLTPSPQEVRRLMGLVDYCEENAMHINPDCVAELERRLNLGENPRILALSTCSSEYTNARTILLTLIEAEMPEAEAIA